METKRFKPLFDKLYLIISIPTATVVLSATAFTAFFEPVALFITVPVSLFVMYFLISPLFGYVELRESALFIKYGLILKKYIPYDRIRAIEKSRGVYSESMMSLKNALEHVNVKYNAFDVTTVSVVGNDELIEELEKRRRAV